MAHLFLDAPELQPRNAAEVRDVSREEREPVRDAHPRDERVGDGDALAAACQVAVDRRGDVRRATRDGQHRERAEPSLKDLELIGGGPSTGGERS